MDYEELFPEMRHAQTMPDSLFPRVYLTEEERRSARLKRIEAKRAEVKEVHLRRRETRKDIKARRHSLLMNPVGPPNADECNLGATMSRVKPKCDRKVRQLQHARRRARPDYYSSWCSRMARYVQRRVYRRGKCVQKRIQKALSQANLDVLS
jgi:hypothetical protein